MGNLICFSGGVESTAMLSLCNPKEDLAVTFVDSTNDRYPRLYDTVDAELELVTQIVDYYKIDHVKVQIDFTHSNPKYYSKAEHVNQLLRYLPLCSILCDRHPTIERVWYGRNSEDWEAGERRNTNRFKIQAQTIWGKIKPNIPLYMPLVEYTKVQCWHMIPKEIQHLVESCYVHRDDIRESGCAFCQEKINLMKALKET